MTLKINILLTLLEDLLKHISHSVLSVYLITIVIIYHFFKTITNQTFANHENYYIYWMFTENISEKKRNYNSFNKIQKSKSLCGLWVDKYYNWHITPASSECPQLWIPNPRNGHSVRDCSFPLQLTSSIHICPTPLPK